MTRTALLILAAPLIFCGVASAYAQDPPPAAAPAAPDAGAAFLAANLRKPGVVTTASGLQYKVLHSGPATGVSPKAGEEVQVAYEGRLLDGTLFDSAPEANPAPLQVGELVPGWNEALQLMRPGDEWELYISPALGYGDEAKGPIPAHSVMVFKLKLVAVGPLQ